MEVYVRSERQGSVDTVLCWHNDVGNVVLVSYMLVSDKSGEIVGHFVVDIGMHRNTYNVVRGNSLEYHHSTVKAAHILVYIARVDASYLACFQKIGLLTVKRLPTVGW